MFIEVVTPSRAVEEAIKLCLAQGKFAKPRGRHTYEVLNPTILIHRPWQLPLRLKGRAWRPFIGAMEALQLVGQTTAPERLVAGAAAFAEFRDGGVFHGAYGPRVHGRLKPLVQQLLDDPHSRQAVLTIFDSRQDLGVDVKDVPCTLSLQYFIRTDNDGTERLHARTTMRSNDVWLGLPYDLIQFIALQGAIAKALDVEMGTYAHSVGSLHLYGKNVPAATEVEALPEPAFVPYSPLWSGRSIGVISSLARRLAFEYPVDQAGLTDFERWLQGAADGSVR